MHKRLSGYKAPGSAVSATRSSKRPRNSMYQTLHKSSWLIESHRLKGSNRSQTIEASFIWDHKFYFACRAKTGRLFNCTKRRTSSTQRRVNAIETIRNSGEPIYQNEHHKARHYTQLNIDGRLGPTEKAWLHQYRRENKRSAQMIDKLYPKRKQRK